MAFALTLSIAGWVERNLALYFCLRHRPTVVRQLHRATAAL
jgi:hypothetical protein